MIRQIIGRDQSLLPGSETAHRGIAGKWYAISSEIRFDRAPAFLLEGSLPQIDGKARPAALLALPMLPNFR